MMIQKYMIGCIFLVLMGCYSQHDKKASTSVLNKDNQSEKKTTSKIMFLDQEKLYRNMAYVRFHSDVSDEVALRLFAKYQVEPLKNSKEKEINQWTITVLPDQASSVTGTTVLNSLGKMATSKHIRHILLQSQWPTKTPGTVSGEAIVRFDFYVHSNTEKLKQLEPFLEGKGAYLQRILVRSVVVQFDASTTTLAKLKALLAEHPRITNITPSRAGGIRSH